MTYIIAEIGQNHDGSKKQAIRLVEAAIAAGVDAVKMQHFKADTLVTRDLKPMAHSATHPTMHERFKSLELPWEVFVEAKELCADYGTDFIITPFDLASFGECAEIADKVKIASGDITYIPLLQAAADCGKDVILSTGMASRVEIDLAVETVDPWAILHCVSLYPTPVNLAQLYRIDVLSSRYFCGYMGGSVDYPTRNVGYSDHCMGDSACMVAVAMGAKVIEKHFTLTPGKTSGDHPHSLDQNGMKLLVEGCLRTEELIGAEDERPDTGMRKWLRRGRGGLRGDS